MKQRVFATNSKSVVALMYLPIIPVCFIVLIILLCTEKNNYFVRFHATQSLVLQNVFFVLLAICGIIILTANLGPCGGILDFWLVLSTTIQLLITFFLLLNMMVNTYNGKLTKLPDNW